MDTLCLRVLAIVTGLVTVVTPWSAIPPYECGDKHYQASEVVKYIGSPGYPRHYDSNMECRWTIVSLLRDRSVLLKVVDQQLGGPSGLCNYDHFSVYDGNSTYMGTVCGANAYEMKTFVSPDNALQVVFKSDSAEEYPGFMLSYQSVVRKPTANRVH